MTKQLLYLLFFLGFFHVAQSQNPPDSVGRKVGVPTVSVHPQDTSKTTISPHRAAIRSAIIPGWGQVSVRKDLKASFFRKYYSIPLIYGAIGASAGAFAYNLTWYRRTRFAYKVLSLKDSSSYPKIHQKLQGYISRGDLNSLQLYRNDFRRSVDYSALLVLLFWGLNVVHASVEAHLKTFDVSNEIGLRFKAGHSDLGGTDGLSLILCFKK